MAIGGSEMDSKALGAVLVAVFNAWSQAAARFSLMFAIHMEAEGTPVVYKDAPMGGRHPLRTGKRTSESDWVERRVYLDRVPRSASSRTDAESVEGDPAADGKQQTAVMVRGHMRRQPYGPEHSLRKWVYVESYEARRWIAPKPLRINVLATPK